MLARLVSTLILAMLVVSCEDANPVKTKLSILSEAQADFDGRHVIVSGTLRTFATPRHYWIENDSHDRVALETEEDLAPWVSQTVEVRGRFFYDPDRGRRIQVEQMSAL